MPDPFDRQVSTSKREGMSGKKPENNEGGPPSHAGSFSLDVQRRCQKGRASTVWPVAGIRLEGLDARCKGTSIPKEKFERKKREPGVLEQPSAGATKGLKADLRDGGTGLQLDLKEIQYPASCRRADGARPSQGRG